VIDGETRLGFVNSHFHLQFQQAGKPAEQKLLRSFIDDRDRRRFDSAVTTCLVEEKDVRFEARMRCGEEAWVRWELRFLEALGEGPGRLFCLGYDLHTDEREKDAAQPDNGYDSDRGRQDQDPAVIEREWQDRLNNQKQLMGRKVREAAVRGEQQERERIGQELHDNISQILSSAQLFLSCLTTDNPDFDTIKEKTAGIIASALQEVRTLSHNIAAPDLRETGLIESINRLVEDLRYAGHTPIEFTSTDWMTLETQSAELKLTVYRIVQEQLHNIGKYSEATAIRITLTGRNEQLRLQITDDGIGFDPKTVRQGLGLNGICRRAKLFNGKAIFNSAPGKGCTLIVAIPLELKPIL
jgi:signal transduction histidine kinase